jgi:tripartite-type tricarboxylate transporter receptor subunit TctC
MVGRRGEAKEGFMARVHSLLLGIAGVVLALTTAAAAQDYPTRPVRVIIPFAPGGLNDIAARVMAQHLSERLGKQFIPENRTGAGGVVGTELAANAAPDGYTLNIVSIANPVQPAIYKLTFDARNAFTPIALFITSPNVLAVNVDLPAKSVKEFIALAKAKPGEIHYASGGTGGSLHLGMELFKMITKIDVVHVPFRGAGPASIDIIAGNTKAMMSSASSAFPHIRSGKMRGLAVASPSRIPALPDVPTFIEAGVPEYQGGNWIGLAAPAGTPKTIIDKLHKEIAAIQDMPEVQKQFENRGAQVVKMSQAEFAKFWQNEFDKWGGVVREAGIKAQ